MKIILLTLLVCFVAFAAVSASPVPVDEGVLGDLPGSDITNPQEDSSFFKLLLLKKKLLLFG